ncbi:MAG: restriction endonuclease subunit S [Phycisphaerales bacterium]
MPEVATPKKSAGWTTVAFGDVVKLSKERSSDPEGDGYERYIGLEHIDPGELRVRRWGDIADGVTFTNVFKPGQVLFGKRRAYQRKVAVADFSGVCSGDIYVLEPKGDALLPELLPFICQTDAFFEHAVGTSAGSLSPRTNWKSLATFQFALPPIEEQRRVAELLQAIDASIASQQNFSATVDATRRAWLDHATRALLEISPELCLNDVCDQITDGAHKTPTYVEDGAPFLRVTDIQDDHVRWQDVKRIPKDEHSELCKRCRPERGDVLLSKNGTIGITKVVDWDTEFSIFVSLCLLKPGATIRSDYLQLMVESPHASRQLLLRIKQGTVKNLHLEEIRECKIPLPGWGVQGETVERARHFLRQRRASDARVSELQSMKTKVLHQVTQRRS